MPAISQALPATMQARHPETRLRAPSFPTLPACTYFAGMMIFCPGKILSGSMMTSLFASKISG